MTSKKHLLLIGTHSDVLQTVEFNESERSLKLKSTLQLAAQPSWIEPHPLLDDIVYSLSRQDDGGLVFALRVHDELGSMEVLGSTSSGGAGPNNLQVSKDGRGLIAVNYVTGTVAMIPLDPSTGLFLSSTSPLRPSHVLLLPYLPQAHPRQESSHPHHVVRVPNSDDVLVPDLGCNVIWRLRWAWSESESSTGVWEIVDKIGGFPEGSGPRHAVVHSSGQFLYTLSEMSSALSVHSLPPSAQSFSTPPALLSVHSILPPAYDSTLFHGASEILLLPPLDPSHQAMLLCTNRDCNDPRGDAIAVFLIETSDPSQLTRGEPAFVFGAGTHLRGMGGDAQGRWVAVLGRDEGRLGVYERTENGKSLREVAWLEQGIQRGVDVLWRPTRVDL